ncbi:CapA family protein [Candidatus Halobonum tyrrellensis]|uniref:Capsule synthesis protein CapA n=1 Tax=Candidatus Halobonum tyrrellensis G22 TaxID=1324957 RepID=V4HHS2_9EURY|nr:CapA family protein [Candidatus Halobonum tyrrellensis]ESP87459.1 capsule synthesis protein CapA [Candidatus Halobonum tyrrellensis G22]
MPRFTLAAAGDAILTRRLSTAADDGLDALAGRIRGTDAAVVNLEVLLHDYEGYPAADSGGTYMRAPPWVADELSWAGFDLFAAATNHTGDYSHGGMEATMRALEARDLPYAGLGRTLSDARAPAYVDTPAGRVALVAACSTVTPGSTAGEQRPDMRGRPGLSPLSLSAEYVVPAEEYDRLRDLSDALGMEAFKQRREEQGFPVSGGDEEGEGLTLLNVGRGEHLRFVPGDEYRVERTPSEADREAVLARVDAAARQADWVVASLHAHEGAGVERNDPTVAPFVESFARDCIDAGADAFVGHGPHVLRGVEVYEGAPVFYSLGDFAMQNETVTRLPAELYDRYDLDTQRALPADLFDARAVDDDGERTGFPADRAFWESVVPVCTFGDGGVERVDLHPVELGYDAPRGSRGRPRLAEGETAARVLADLADLSEPYGTDIAVGSGVGVVSP